MTNAPEIEPLPPNLKGTCYEIKPGMLFDTVDRTWVVLRQAVAGELCHDTQNQGAYKAVQPHKHPHLWWCKDVRASDYAAMLLCITDTENMNFRMP